MSNSSLYKKVSNNKASVVIIIVSTIIIIIFLALIPSGINSCNYVRNRPCYYQRDLCTVEESYIMLQYNHLCSVENTSYGYNHSFPEWFVKIELNDNSCREQIRGTIRDKKKCITYKNNETFENLSIYSFQIAVERLNKYKVNRKYKCYYEQKYCSDDDSKQNITWINPDNKPCYSSNDIYNKCSYFVIILMIILSTVIGIIPGFICFFCNCFCDCDQQSKIETVSPPPYDKKPQLSC